MTFCKYIYLTQKSGYRKCVTVSYYKTFIWLKIHKAKKKKIKNKKMQQAICVVRPWRVDWWWSTSTRSIWLVGTRPMQMMLLVRLHCVRRNGHKISLQYIYFGFLIFALNKNSSFFILLLYHCISALSTP